MARPQRKRVGEGISEELREAAAGSGAKVLPIDQISGIRPGQVLDIPLEQIEFDPTQPRKRVDEQELSELAGSLKRDGLINAITVIKKPDAPGFLLESGERRVRAARLAGWTTIRATVSDGAKKRIRQLVENVQREDLHPMDLANFLFNLKGETGWADAQLAAEIGKSRTMVNELLRLTELPDDLKEELTAAVNVKRSLILEAFRVGGPEKVRAVLAGEETLTRASIRSKKKPEMGRPKNHREVIKDDESGAELVIRFPKAKVDEHEIRAVLDRASARYKPRSAGRSA